MKKFEYCYADTIQELNSLGENGWEVVCYDEGNYRYTLKREKIEQGSLLDK